MRFTHPAYLLLMLPVVAGLILSFRHVHGMMKLRKRLAFAIRFLLASCLVLALGGPEAHRPNHGLCTIFVLDRSDSISDADYAKAKQFIAQSVKQMRSDDQVGLIVFGHEPMVERTPGDWRDLGQIQSVVEPSASDLGAGIRLAAASFPAGKARRIVLLSDGNETNGDAAGAAMAAAADGIEVDHVPLGLTPREGEVVVVGTEMPSEIRVDQPFDVRVLVDASKPTTGTLVLDRNGEIVKKQAIRLNPGRNALVMRQVLDTPGFHRYQATVLAEGDRDNRNNIGMGFVSVRGRPRFLILQNTPSPSPLADAIRKQGIVTDVYGPGGVPARPEELQAYDAVVFNDINANMMTPDQMKLVQAAVKNSGVGFAMIGGEDSFLPGGYYGSPIADILPVDLNIRQRKSFPSTSIIVVCDVSGSMGMVEDGVPKVRLAAKAAEQTILLLSPMDRAGVVGSTDAIEFVAPMQKLTDKDAVIRQIRTLSSGGGGIYIRPSLEFAHRALAGENSSVRHLILMADGSDCDEREGAFEEMARMRAEKMTASVISIGNGQFVPFLQRLAQIGGGKFYLAEKASQLPAVFTQDAAVMARAAIQDGAFLPKAAVGEDAMRGIDPGSVPPLLAYCLTDSRPMAQVGMRTDKDDPLLAVWQYGLGTSMAFTSDAQARWAARWVTWDQFGVFWAQALRGIARRATRNAYEVVTTHQGAAGVVELKAFDASGNPLTQFAGQVQVSNPSGSATKVAMTQTAPGVYHGEFEATELGSYIVTVAEDDPAGGKRVDATGLSIPYPPEYREYRANTPLLGRISSVTGGRKLKSPNEAARPVANPGHSVQELWALFVWLAALLLPLDVGCRRVAVPIGELLAKSAAWMRERRRQAKKPAAQTVVVERLSRAKRTAPAAEPSEHVRPVVIERTETPRAATPTPPAGGSAASRLLEAKRKREGKD